MDRITIWVFFISFFVLLHATHSVEEEVKSSLIKFLGQLSNTNGLIDPSWGWNTSSDPCNGQWKGVLCNIKSTWVKKIILDGVNLAGTLDANSLCEVKSLSVLSLVNNSINGEIPPEIGNCKQLTHLYLSSNRFEGNLPESFSRLSNLKRLYISNNKFSGELPDLARISGLVTFLADNNQLNGEIPEFDFSNLQDFNVSFNRFSGPVPDLKGLFGFNSIMSNPGLCGEPSSNACPPSPPPEKKSKSKSVSTEKALMYSGYLVIGLLLIVFVAFKLIKRNKNKDNIDVVKKGETKDKPSNGVSSDKPSRSEYSITSAESGMVSQSLIILTTPVVKELRFEDLLKAPAELLGRGRHGSLYKVILEDGKALAVKRIKDWIISSNEFKKRMQKIDQVKHMNVLPPVAFYCSKQEKLLVYEFQQNGSLFKILHETKNGTTFDWESRVSVAASLADALAFMHDGLREEGIAHGNLKSSNIIFNENMEPCISEYGLMVVDNQGISSVPHASTDYKTTNQHTNFPYSTLKVDVYSFGIILLELLTGKQVQSNGSELARWVHSVVREEWTAEVFDRALTTESASEERMVNLLQVALKCINPAPEARISMNQVAIMINTIKEDDESSIVSEP